MYSYLTVKFVEFNILFITINPRSPKQQYYSCMLSLAAKTRRNTFCVLSAVTIISSAHHNIKCLQRRNSLFSIRYLYIKK